MDALLCQEIRLMSIDGLSLFSVLLEKDTPAGKSRVQLFTADIEGVVPGRYYTVTLNEVHGEDE